MHNKWTPYELHTHTKHSDGQFTVMSLAETAKSCGLEGIAITDHNTLIPRDEIEAAKEATGLDILGGMEWTTFYGHMVVLGTATYVDWRKMALHDIHTGIDKVHGLGGIVGIAHPYRVGSPLCTGCFWQYDIENWNDIDYIEVWSESQPSRVEYNTYAYDLWIDLLNQGYHVTASYGLDWHRPYGENDVVAVAYLALDQQQDFTSERQVIEAIRAGRISITMGPVMDILIQDTASKEIWSIGDTVETKETILEVQIIIDYSYRQELWELEGENIRLVLRSNKGNLIDEEVTIGEEYLSKPIETDGLQWVIGELYGKMKGVDMQIGLTNPIFF